MHHAVNSRIAREHIIAAEVMELERRRARQRAIRRRALCSEEPRGRDDPSRSRAGSSRRRWSLD
jgi:hypothetical protein